MFDIAPPPLESYIPLDIDFSEGNVYALENELLIDKAPVKFKDDLKRAIEQNVAKYNIRHKKMRYKK